MCFVAVIKRMNRPRVIFLESVVLGMPPRFRRLFPDSSFLRKWLVLTSGTVMGQGILIISSPLLTRLFTPEEFGLFVVFAALVAIFGVGAGLRYERAVPLAATDEEAAAIVTVVFLASGLVAMVLAGFVWLIGDWLAGRLDADGLALWLWLLPPSVLIWGGGLALNYWFIRRHAYGVNALNRTAQFGTQTAAQLAMGAAGWGAPGLILGYFCGYIVRFGHYFMRVPYSDLRLFVAWRWPRLKVLVREHWRYPAFSVPAGLLTSVVQLGPEIIVAVMFGPAMAGIYALAQRVVGLPIRMLSEAASQVFLGELRGLERAALRRLFLRTVALFSSLGLLGMLPLLIFAPPLFRLVFGEGWAEAGVLAQLLIPLFFARFVDMPVSQLLDAINRHQANFLITIMQNVIMVGGFFVSALMALSVFETIFLFSMSQTILLVYRLLYCWAVIK
jgi:O-antigen/teichoic acid export membrane protein